MSPADVTVQGLAVWAAAISTILALGTTLWNLLSSGPKATARKLAEIEAARQSDRARIDAIERAVEGVPGHEAIHGLHLSMERMHGDLRELRAVINGNSQIMARLETIVTRHEDHLLDGAKR